MSEQLDMLSSPAMQPVAAAVAQAVPELDAEFWDGLRDWQQRCIGEIRQHIREGKKNILICAPTGAGKTRLASYVINETARKLKRANFVVDRINLIDQTATEFDKFQIKFGVHQADHWKFRPWERVQLCSAQTLARRKWPEADVDVFDEAHTLYDTQKKRMAGRTRITLGLSATPFTKELGLYFDALVNVTTTNELIGKGLLSPYKIFAASEPDMTGVKVSGGEWDEKESSKRALEVVGDCVAEYLAHGEGKKFICQAVDVDHVKELHRQFMEAGVMCATYTYLDKDEDRKEIVEEYRKPDSFYRGLITVTAATKGFDVPDIGVLIMAKPYRKSLADVIQFFGRGLRVSPETGKEVLIVLDHSGNLHRFWKQWTEFFELGAQELDDGKKSKSKEKLQDLEDTSMKCPKCKHLHMAMPNCPNCGFEYPRKTKGVQHKAGKLKEVAANGDPKKMNAEIWPQVVTYAKEKRGLEGEKYAMAIYKSITGEWPRSTYHATDGKPLTDAIRKRIVASQIRFAKGKAKAK
jgi:superfamily II DNA or RNA helicase